MIRALAFLAFLIAVPCFAQDGDAAQADPRVGEQLDEIGIQYQVDDDGDYRSVFEFDGEKRSQVVYVNSKTAQNQGVEVREVWSPAFESKSPLTAKVANRLLEASFDAPLGAWQTFKQANGNVVVAFAAKIVVDTDAETLRKVITMVISHADEMEKELTSKDTY